jgi:hypothetical protein
MSKTCPRQWTTVVVIRALFLFLLRKHFITEKNLKKKSGEAKDSVNFSFFILLHKRTKPILPSYLLPHLRARTQTLMSMRRLRRRILLPCFANAKPLPEAGNNYLGSECDHLPEAGNMYIGIHPQTIPPPIDCGRRRRRRTSQN